MQKCQLSYRLLGMWYLVLYGKGTKLIIKQLNHIYLVVVGVTKVLYCPLVMILHVSLFFLKTQSETV